ncbi:hypothetical protein BgAZ_206280 [Babesia gibsoni]|uniref:Mitochondrial carrier protein n=1 Tax=Babesia gibsoni TaxID=33632 RepID=A0AAD8LLC7_BABGI|nr:hypothetical protein BgAZ_206280 [Babesia gibsoni]
MESDHDDRLNYEEWQGDCKFWQHAVCGSAAGVMEHIALFPLDTLKTRLHCGWCHCKTNTAVPAVDRVRRFSVLCIQRSQLFQNLFRGSSVIAVGCIPAHIMYFSVYEATKKYAGVTTSGAMATLCHDIVLTPADVVKQRLQLGTYRSSLYCFQHIIRNEGIQALYRSLSVTLFMNVPYHALLVTVNEFLIKMYPRKKNSNSIYTYFLYAAEQSLLEVNVCVIHALHEKMLSVPCYFEAVETTIICHVHVVPLCLSHLITFSGIGGAIAGALTNPIDVIKTRLQTQGYQMTGPNSYKPQYRNPMEAVRLVYRDHGFRGFWRGTITRVGLCVPAAAICWGTYASLKNAMVRFNES